MEDYVYRMYLYSNPYAKAEDIEYWFQATTYDIFIKFKNGRKSLYQVAGNYERPLPYEGPTLTEEEFKQEFGIRLKRFMLLRYFSQEDLAAALETSQAMISRYVKGKVLPSAYAIQKIADTMDLPVEDFYYREH